MARTMRTLKQLLAGKPKPIHSVKPDASVFEALSVMAKHDIGAVMVFEAGKVVGVLTERDYARKGILTGRLSKDTPVRELMTPEVIFVTPEKSIEECMAIMTSGAFRHLPVMEDGRLIGIVSMRDLVREIIDFQRRTIEDLRRDMITVMTPDPSSY
ncbi:MAG TPA: CBS domain-containing protein [Rhodospirillales bacterium]|nr:CBS domain-containing protein [Rhodospirillales bacterium]